MSNVDLQLLDLKKNNKLNKVLHETKIVVFLWEKGRKRKAFLDVQAFLRIVIYLKFLLV